MTFYLDVKLKDKKTLRKQSLTYEQEERIRTILGTHSDIVGCSLHKYIELYHAEHLRVPSPELLQRFFPALVYPEIIIAWEQAINHYEGGESF